MFTSSLLTVILPALTNHAKDPDRKSATLHIKTSRESFQNKTGIGKDHETCCTLNSHLLYILLTC